MSDFDRILASSPVNVQAAKQMGKGISFTPGVNIQNSYREMPETKPILNKHLANPSFIDLTGKVFGRLTVMGLAVSNSKKTASWVCRCTCGMYAKAKKKSLLNSRPSGGAHMCGSCSYTQSLRREVLPGMKNYKEPNP